MLAPLPFIVFYIIGVLCLTITFIVVWLKNLRETIPFMPVGVVFVLAVLAMDVAAIFTAGIGEIGKPVGILVAMITVTVFRIYACTVVGLLLARRLRVSQPPGTSTLGATLQQTSYGASAVSKETLIYAMLTTVFMVLYSVILFRISGASVAAALQNGDNLPIEISSLSILVVASMGFSEEIIFRLGLQTGLAYLWRSSRFGHHWAILGTTILWCAGHVGTLDPDWVKIVQIFVFGLALGYLYKRFGIFACVIVHVLFNVVMALLAPALFAHGAVTW